MLIFTIWSCCYLTNKESADVQIGYTLEYVNLCLAIYFLMIECISLAGICRGKTEWKNSTVILELLISFACPIMNLACQVIDYFNEANLDKAEWFWFWELIAWTAFVLYLRLFIMLRSIELLSPSITMILRSFSEMVPYFSIVVMGVMAFTNTFLAVRQVIYIKHAADDSIDESEKVERPFENDIEVIDFWSWKDKWMGEYIAIF